jgi:predicted phage terminase large subunit-like protein
MEAGQRTGSYQEVLATLCRQDLFFLLVYILARKDADRDWIFERCREVQSDPNGHIDIWAREHYKSTIITFALTIQDIINNPEVTIGIFSHTRPIAKKFLFQIQYELENNKRLKEIFPDIFWNNPKKEAPKWSLDHGLVVKRRSNPKEATVEAHGLVDGQPTGMHYDIMVYDDVVVKASVTTPDMIAKTTEGWELSLNLTKEEGIKRYIGTRYHYNDTYKVIIERGSAIKREHPGTYDGTVRGEPVLWSKDLMAEKRRDMGPYVFSCQILCDPKADETQGFFEKWLKFWPNRYHSDLNIYFTVDPANEKRKENDYTSMWCVGLGRDQNIYVIDMIRDRLNLTERTNLLFGWHQRYRPLGVIYEQYGMQTDIQHIEFVQDLKNYRFPITPIGGKTGKYDRIRRLIPIFEEGRIFLPEKLFYRNYENKQEDLVHTFINDEFKPFPVSVHEDMLDALARLFDPAITLMYPIIEKAPITFTQSEKDWMIVTGQDDQDQTAFHLED